MPQLNQLSQKEFSKTFNKMVNIFENESLDLRKLGVEYIGEVSQEALWRGSLNHLQKQYDSKNLHSPTPIGPEKVQDKQHEYSAHDLQQSLLSIQTKSIFLGNALKEMTKNMSDPQQRHLVEIMDAIQNALLFTANRASNLATALPEHSPEKQQEALARELDEVARIEEHKEKQFIEKIKSETRQSEKGLEFKGLASTIQETFDALSEVITKPAEKPTRDTKSLEELAAGPEVQNLVETMRPSMDITQQVAQRSISNSKTTGIERS